MARNIDRIERRPLLEKPAVRVALTVGSALLLGALLTACGAHAGAPAPLHPLPSGFPAGGPDYPGPQTM